MSRIYRLIVLVAALACTSKSAYSEGSSPERQILVSARRVPTFAPIVIDVTVRNKRLKAVIDTGSSDVLFDRRHENLLGKRSDSPLGDNGDLLREYGRQQIWIGSHAFRVDRAYSADLNVVSHVVGPSVDCIIGMSVLRNVVLSLSDGNCDLTMSRPTIGRTMRRLRIEIDESGLPQVLLKCGTTKESSAVIDTGLLQSMMIDRTTLKEAVRAQAIDMCEFARPFTGLSGRASWTGVGRIRRVTLREYHVDDVVAVVGEEVKIGRGFLARADVVLDFPKNEMFIGTSVQTNLWDHSDSDGLVIGDTMGRYEVIAVDGGSLSDDSGVKPADVVVAIDSHSISGKHQEHVDALLKEFRRESLTLSLLRNGERIQVEIPARP